MERAKLMYVGSEDILNEIRTYIKDEWEGTVITTPVYADENENSCVTILVEHHRLPIFCTALGLHIAHLVKNCNTTHYIMDVDIDEMSNLITDMTMKGASQNDISKAIKQSIRVMDSRKYNLYDVLPVYLGVQNDDTGNTEL